MGLCASNAVAAKPETSQDGVHNTEEDPPIKSFGRQQGSRNGGRRDSIAYNKAAMEKREAAQDPTARAPNSMVDVVS